MYNLLMINYGGIRERSLPLLNIHNKVVLTNIRLLSTQILIINMVVPVLEQTDGQT
jgi:hypothetical protein